MQNSRSERERGATPLTDAFGRDITYLRLSVTDRCDLRCAYCMSEHMTFLPKKDLLSLEELQALSDAFIERGVRKDPNYRWRASGTARCDGSFCGVGAAS